MIEHVQQGEKITADKQNQIIDAANGQNTPSDNFVNTGKGTIFPNGPAKETFNPTLVPPYIFQTKWCNTFRMTLRTDDKNDKYDLDDPKRSWYVYLGPDLDETKNYVKRLFDITLSFKMYIMSKYSDSDVEISNKLLSAWSTGYVDTTFYVSKKINLMYVKTWYQVGTGPEMYHHWSVLITDANTDGEIVSKLYNLIQEKEGHPQNKSQMLDICTIAKRNGNDKTFQYPFSPKLPTTTGIKTDSEISAAQLSSLQPYLYYDSEISSNIKGYEIWKFHDLSAVNNPWMNNEVSCYDIISRYKEYGDKPAMVRYIPLSSLDSNISVDSEMPNVKLSSLEHKKDNGKDYYQIYDFDDLKNTKKTTNFHDISKVDIIVRNRETTTNKARVEYLQLSSVLSGNSSVLTDTEDTANQKSIEHNQIDGKNVLQLHNFHTGEDLHAMELDLDNPKGKWDDEERRTFLVRHETDKGAVLEYADINLSSLSDSHKVDSEIPALQLSSLEHKTYSYVDKVTGKLKKTDYYLWFRFHDGKELCKITFDKNHKTGFIEGSSENDTFTHPIRYVNNNNDRIVKYAVLSVNISSDPGDSNIENETSSILHVDDKFYRLYNFDSTTIDNHLGFDAQDNNFTSRYWEGFTDPVTAHSNESYENFNAAVLLNRDNSQGNNVLKYGDFSLLLPKYTMGDSNYNGNYYSISSYVDNGTDPKYGLYKFLTDEGHTLEMNVPDIEKYYNNGDTTLSPTGNDKDNMDVVVRNRNDALFSIDYRKLSVTIPPFVHGDADSYPNTSRYSIDSVTFVNSPDKSYYQLHNFNSPGSLSEESELLSDDYINIANGQKKGSDVNDMVLIRNDNGELVYRKLYVKGGSGGSWDEQRILSIENSIDDIDNDIDNIRNDISNIVDDIRGDIESLSNAISGLSGNYWYQGGDSNTNYGSSIGDSNKNTVINLDGRTLVGNWTAAADFKVNGDITCDNDIFGFNVNGTNGKFNTIMSQNGADITVDNNIDMSNHEIKNASKIGDINLTTKQLVGDWKTTGEHTVDGCINCDWVFKNDGSHGDGVNVGGLQLYGKWSTNDNFAVNGTLTIGSTTITEAQLQQLLALLS